MIFRNSINSIIRSKGKTALFTLVIFALTLALSLAVSVWASVAQFLDDCDDYYTTIGLVEYMGTNYPDDDIYDPAMASGIESFDASILTEEGSLINWETPARTFGYVEGFWRTDTYMPDKMLSVFVVGNVSYSEENQLYSAIVFKTLYSSTVEDNKYVYIEENFGDFEQDHYYLVFGEIYHGYSPILHLRKTSFDNAIVAKNAIDIPNMIDITSDITENTAYNIPENSILNQVAETLEVTNNSVLVSSTNNLMALLPFHQEELYFIEGRSFTEEEYTSGSPVVVISEIMADRLEVTVGDTINLSTAVSDLPGVYNSYWFDDGFSFQNTFTVVGITNTVMDKSWYVYVPRAVGIPASDFPIGYTVGHATLRNDQAAAFYGRIESVLDDRFQLKIYDQGYSSVAIPYQTILRTAQIVTFVCGLVEFAVVILFAYLFVYRQYETSRTMLMLGAGKPRVFAYFLIGAGVIASLATSAGSAAGYWLHDKIIALVARTAENFTLIDSRYSNGSLTISRTLEFAPDLNWQFFISLGITVFTLILIAIIGFTINTFVDKKSNKQKIRSPKSNYKTSRLPGGSMKYTLLSIWRGGARTFVVPLLAISVVIFFGQLSNTTEQYRDQLESIYDNTTINGYFTDINGKQIGNLVLNAYDVANLYYREDLSELNVSIGRPYYFTGINQLADGTPQNLSPLHVPDNNYRRESMISMILRGPDLTATNDIHTSPEFYYADTIEMSFLNGIDESILAVPSEHPMVSSCIISTDLMAEHQISLADTIRVSLDRIITNPENTRKKIFLYIDLKVVGSYEKQGTEDTIYAPLALFFDTDLLWGEEQPASGPPTESVMAVDSLTIEQRDALQSSVFHSANFKLKNSRDLISLKDFLTDYGFSEVRDAGKVREFIILRDASFNNAVASIKQQNHYIHILYPFLYALVGIITISVSYLLIVSRKYELATMRGLGTKETRTFFSFFSEQSILCLLGIAIGAAFWYAFWGIPSKIHLIMSGCFILCYFIGSAISIFIMNHSHVLTILLDRE
jgi:ABC-type lipoprotein release transport system permease subunit